MALETAYDATAMAGSLKQTYAPKIAEFTPPSVVLQKQWKFVSDMEREGDKYHQMVVLSQSAGFTKGGSSAITTAYALNPAIPAYSADAVIQATETIGREWISYGIMEKARGAGPAAFVNAFEYMMKQLVRSTAKRVEIELLYGGPVNPAGQSAATMTDAIRKSAGLGLIGSPVASTNTITGTISLATWAPGIWGGLENAQLDVVDAAVAAPVVLNTNGPITLTKVTLSSRAVTLTCAANADATAIAAATAPVVYFRGNYGSESLGVRSILCAGDGTVTSANTLFTIPLVTYSYWDPVTYNFNGGPITMQKLFAMVTIANARGLDGDLLALVPSSSWNDLMVDMTAFRRFDSSYKKGEASNGFDRITLYSQAGTLTIMPSLFIKQGDACVLDNNGDTWRRVGSTDITFESPSGAPMVLELPSNAGREVRDFSCQAAFTPMPSRNVWGFNALPSTTAS